MLAKVRCDAGAVVAAGGQDAGQSGDALKTSRQAQVRTISRMVAVECGGCGWSCRERLAKKC